ncbi:MAG: exonuclease domain-containing protein [Actinomycetota bacterium]|nr:exonuclease domain-containing protein [Actinomycetota bacterium]
MFRRKTAHDGLFVYPELTPDGNELGSTALAAIDVETTGLSASDDRVCEIAVVRFDRDGTVLDEWATLVDPERDVGPTFVHHITNDMVSGAPRFAEIVGDVLARLDGAVLVAHNARFEEGFVRAELDRLGVATPPIPALCTLSLARSVVHAPNYQLDTCCESVGITHDDAHSALGDCRVTGRLAASLLARGTVPVTWACDPEPLPRLPATARPRTRATNLRKGEVGWMANLVARLPLTTDDAHPVEADAYLAALTEALADGKLTGPEAKQLGRLAGAAGLGAEQVRALNRRFLDSMREAAEDDDILTPREVRELTRAAELLDEADHFAGLEPTGVDPTAPRRQASSTGPRVWCAPGIDAAVADRLRVAGYSMAVNLTRSVVAVVCDDPAADHPKLRRARDLGIRLVATPDAAMLITELANGGAPATLEATPTISGPANTDERSEAPATGTRPNPPVEGPAHAGEPEEEPAKDAPATTGTPPPGSATGDTGVDRTRMFEPAPVSRWGTWVPTEPAPFEFTDAEAGEDHDHGDTATTPGETALVTEPTDGAGTETTEAAPTEASQPEASQPEASQPEASQPETVAPEAPEAGAINPIAANGEASEGAVPDIAAPGTATASPEAPAEPADDRRPLRDFAPPPHATPAWLADPCGRADLRWFDGTRWTHHAATGGAVRSDTPWLPDAEPEAPGLVDGQPVDEHARALHELYLAGRDLDALILGYRCIDAAENAATTGAGPAPRPLYALVWHVHTRRGEHEEAATIAQRLAVQEESQRRRAGAVLQPGP